MSTSKHDYIQEQINNARALLRNYEDELKALGPKSDLPYEYSFVDVESTGLNAKRHQVIEIAVTRCKADLTIIENYDVKIAMWPGSRKRAENKALAINGYTDEEWKDAPYPSLEIYSNIARLTDNTIMCSQNVEFDKEFISQSMNHFGIDAKWQRRCVDIQSYSAIIGEHYNLKSWGLGEVYKALGGPVMPMHRARPDVQKAMFLYEFARRMMRAGLHPKGELRATTPDTFSSEF